MFLCSFIVPENQEEKSKRKSIEDALRDPNTPLEKWQDFAKSEYGLINGMRQIYHSTYVYKHDNKYIFHKIRRSKASGLAFITWC